MLWGAILVCVMRLKIDLTAMRRAPWAIKNARIQMRSLACRCLSPPLVLSTYLSLSLSGVVHLGSSCFFTIHKCYFYAQSVFQGGVERAGRGADECVVKGDAFTRD